MYLLKTFKESINFNNHRMEIIERHFIDLPPEMPVTREAIVYSSSFSLGKFSGQIISNGGLSEIYEMGMVYGPLPNPTTRDNKYKCKYTVQSGGFVIEPEINLGEVYDGVIYARCYAMNRYGISYGNVLVI